MRPNIYVGNNYYQFINYVMMHCLTNYALICHDDVILPETIDDQVACCIRKADAEFGMEKWAFIGNAGINAINHQIVRFIKDNNDAPLPWATSYPYPAAHLDGNTLLAHVGNCRARGFVMPEDIKVQEIYDLVLVIQSYIVGLICGIDSTLFVIHEGSCDMRAFEYATREPSFTGYFVERFINHRFITINGLACVENRYNYLVPEMMDNRSGFYTDCIGSVISAIYLAKPLKKLYLVTMTDGRSFNKVRRFLDSVRVFYSVAVDVVDFEMIILLEKEDVSKRISLDKIVDDYRDVPIRVKNKSGPDNEGYEFVNTFMALEDECIGNSENYIWFVDVNDFIMPSIVAYLPIVLHPDVVTVFDVQVFNERWDESDRSVPYQVQQTERIKSSSYYTWLMGEQKLSKSALIFPVKLFQKFYDVHKETDCQSNEALLMYFACNVIVDTVPLVAVGIGCDHDFRKADKKL
ncbi:MAG TPA: hypothetical protein PLA65_17865, partial [Spirochaetota bacterium]|nr:hypothetical protein [Spirochaetota bacterium]